RLPLADGNDPPVLEAVRAMIDRVLIWRPETDGEPPRIELIGELLAMLQAGLGGTTASESAVSLDPTFATAVRSVKDGTRAEPLAFLASRDFLHSAVLRRLGAGGSLGA
ncbi:MAG TPA: hypothetical protein VIZ17_19130, partial [Acetobacteraceae bacterium]